MTRRINPEYAAMAYRKALLLECVNHLQQHTGSQGVLPDTHVLAEELFDESQVPEAEITEFICDMQQEVEHLRVEMGRFDFVRRASDQSNQPEKTEATGQKVRTRVAK